MSVGEAEGATISNTILELASLGELRQNTVFSQLLESLIVDRNSSISKWSLLARYGTKCWTNRIACHTLLVSTTVPR